MQALDLTADIIDVRDIIERFEHLASAGYNLPISGNTGLMAECKKLEEILQELAGNGGDEEWRGEWYPVTLIKDSYFEEYARELVVECGYVSKDFPHWIAIDWEKTAEAVQDDYTYINVGDDTYWYR